MKLSRPWHGRSIWRVDSFASTSTVYLCWVSSLLELFPSGEADRNHASQKVASAAASMRAVRWRVFGRWGNPPPACKRLTFSVERECLVLTVARTVWRFP